jgi:hypothetical protein
VAKKRKKNLCAVELGKLGGLATAKKKKTGPAPKKRSVKKKKTGQASLF